MGLSKLEQGNEEIEVSRFAVKSYVSCFWLFSVSIVGGVVVGWWAFEFHPSNSQLWMVPLGLILLLTPVFIWFAVFVSDLWNSSDDARQKPEHPSVGPLVHRDAEIPIT